MTDKYDVIVVDTQPGSGFGATVAINRRLKTPLVDREDLPREKSRGDEIPAFTFLLMRASEYFSKPHPHYLKAIYLTGFYGAYSHHPVGETERIPVQIDRWEGLP